METKLENEKWQLLVQQLKQVAAEKGISSYDIADLTGLKQPNVTRFFSGKHKPSLELFIKIANVIGVEVRISINEYFSP